MRAWKLLPIVGALLLLLLTACSDDKTTNPPPGGPAIEAVEDLGATRVDPTMIALRWSAPEVSGTIAPERPAFYELLYQEMDLPASTPAEVRIHACDMKTHPAGCPERYIFDGLSPNTAYRLWVRAVDATGNRSPQSNGIEVRTPTLPGPGSPKAHPVGSR